MPKITLESEMKIVKVGGKEEEIAFLDNKKFNTFNPKVLGLGDISLPSTRTEALAAVFDLSGFTNFCSQIDPHLSVPEYLSRFLNWLFDDIKKQFVEKSYKEGKKLWAELPFLAKFLGDGVLFLWDTEETDEIGICNTAALLGDTCLGYETNFYPKIKKVVAKAPKTLRCGIARGSAFSVGNGQDYVGPCINVASRLQKLSPLKFCASRRGFDFDKYMHKDTRPDYVVKSVSLPGIGENELVWIFKQEFDGLPEKEKRLFRRP